MITGFECDKCKKTIEGPPPTYGVKREGIMAILEPTTMVQWCLPCFAEALRQVADDVEPLGVKESVKGVGKRGS